MEIFVKNFVSNSAQLMRYLLSAPLFSCAQQTVDVLTKVNERP